MKKHFRLWIITSFALALLIASACTSDALPEPNEEVKPEAPSEMLDSYHDKIRTQPYPKVDNEVYLNPTPLIVPQAMKTAEFLQFSLSRSADFSSPETLFSEPQAWCMFNPHQTMETGTWYWRFRSITADGQQQAWSDTYQFEIKDETPRFVTPSFETFYTNAPRLHPRLYCFLDGRMDEARKSVSSHPEYKALRSRAATALAINLSTLGNPYDRIEEIKSYVQSLSQAYYLTQQYIYSKRLHEILQLLLSTPVADKQLFATNFGSTDIAYCFITVYDLLYSTLSADEKAGTEEMLLRILRYYYPQQCGVQENHIFDNHFWQQNMRVLFQATFLLYDKDIYSKEALPMMKYYYELWTARAPASGFNRDGVWHNGSGYFINNVETLYYIPMLFSYISRKDFLQHPWYQNAGQSLVYSWAPQSKSGSFGDGSEKGDSPLRQRVAFADFLARETGNAYAGWYADQCRTTLQQDIDLRLYRMASLHSYATELPADCPKFVWYKDAGEVAMHSNLTDTKNDLALSFRSSIFGSGSHTLSNQNAFNLLYRGVDVYRSSGYYLNFSDAHNLMSYRHSRAHNTILVNGIGQPYSTKGYGNIARVMGGKHITYCLGDASKAYSGITDDPLWTAAFEAAHIEQTPQNGFGTTPLTKYRRHILMLHPNIILLYDELEASEPVRWDWLLHSPTRFYIDPSQQMVTTTNTDKNFNTVTQLFSEHPFSLAQTDQFVVPPTAVPDPRYPNQWHLTATFNSNSKTRILTIIQVTPADKQVHIVRRNGNSFQCGDWNIVAELNTVQPASLVISNRKNQAVFSYGSNNPLLGGETYPREHPQSSLLYDEINGEYRVTEQTDHLPASTRAAL